MNQPTTLLAQALLVDALTHVASGTFSGVLYAAKVGLIASPYAPNLLSTYADMVQPTFPGYAEVAATFVPPFQQPDGSFATNGGLALFQMTDATVPTTVYGYYVTDGGMTPKLLWVEMLEAPIGLTSPLQAILVSAQLALGGTNYGSGTVVT